MMDEQLYLFEVLLDNIYFEEVVGEVPPKKQIVVSVKLGNIVTLEIRSETLPVSGEAPNKRLVDFKSGRSYLCFMTGNNLIEELDKDPLEVTVGVRGAVEPIGTSNAPWDDSFKEMVLLANDPTEFVTPATIMDHFCLMENGVIKGNVRMFLRLSCFGQSIQTQFEILHEGGNKQFMFKTPNMATTFACSRYGTGTSNDFIPISALYNGGNIRMEVADRPAPTNKSASWTAVMEQRASSMFDPRSSIISEFLFPEYLNMITPIKESAITFDIVSIRARADDDKFLDFLTGKKMRDFDDLSVHSMTFTDTEGNERIIFIADEQGRATLGPLTFETESAEEKVSKACQCPKTPTVCKHVLDAIERYEKSHPDLMIHGKRVKYEKLLKRRKESKEKSKDSLLRLKGGSDKEDIPPYQHKKGKGCYNPDCPMAKKLRSVGISQMTEHLGSTDNEIEFFCADFYCPESTRRNVALQVVFSEDPIPFHFNCPNKYCPASKMFKRLGLGPLAIEKCQGTLYGPVQPPVQYGLSQTYGTFDTYGPYGIFSKTNTPFLPDNDDGKNETREILRLRGGGALSRSDSTSSRLRAGAASKSPIAECQEVMDQFDKILEDYRNALESGGQNNFEEFMPHSMTRNCGHPRCTYISEPALPPIHWDCPDPLPVGLCKNPECPYLPQDLKRIYKILASRGHKNNEEGTTNDKLNYNINSAPACTIRNTSQEETKCPFYNPPKIINMMQFGIEPCCSNPKCPMKNIVSSCSNPDCPFAHQEIGEPCSNPNCPLRKNNISAPCSNPDCPFKQQEIPAPCSNPDCPFNKPSEESCHNPDCPFMQKKSESSGESCGNPDCPFKTKADSGMFADGCDATSECLCDNPNCPAHKETCSNPECPFNLQDAEICANPKCPYKTLPSAKKRGICGSADRSVCGDATCPFHEGAGDEGEEKGDAKQSTTVGGAGEGVKKDEGKTLTQAGGGIAIEEGVIEITSGKRPSRYDFAPCTLTTCRFMGGKLKCVDCATLTEGRRRGPCPRICPGDPKCPLSISGKPRKKPIPPEFTKKALRRARKQFVYHFGDKYPGMHIGHHDCVVSHSNVPPKMGWLWNAHVPCLNLKVRRGWRPGAIGKTIMEAIQAHRRAQNMAPLEEGKRKRKKKYGGNESETELIHPKPTLLIKRKEGVYYITMNPLKDPSTLVTNENPYMECKPMTFKILKNKDQNDYKSCICNDQGVVYEPESSSSDSELDIEFTPPAGLIRPERYVRLRDVIHIDTQYNAQDFAVDKPSKGGKREEKDKETKKGKDKKKGKKGKGKGKGKGK